jgi:hypothetical protein
MSRRLTVLHFQNAVKLTSLRLRICRLTTFTLSMVIHSPDSQYSCQYWTEQRSLTSHQHPAEPDRVFQLDNFVAMFRVRNPRDLCVLLASVPADRCIRIPVDYNVMQAGSHQRENDITLTHSQDGVELHSYQAFGEVHREADRLDESNRIEAGNTVSVSDPFCNPKRVLSGRAIRVVPEAFETLRRQTHLEGRKAQLFADYSGSAFRHCSISTHQPQLKEDHCSLKLRLHRGFARPPKTGQSSQLARLRMCFGHHKCHSR